MGWAVIPGLLASALGTGLSIDASSQEQSAANKAASNEVALQDTYAKQGKNAFEQSLSQSTPQAVKQQQDAGSGQALKNYAQVSANGLPGSSLTQGTDPSQAQSEKVENQIVDTRNQQSNTAASALQGYTASDVAQWIKDLQAKTQLGQIGTFAQESEGTLPLQLQQALNSQSTLSGIGSLLNSFGGLASIYGAVNSGGGGNSLYNPSGVYGSGASAYTPFNQTGFLYNLPGGNLQ